MDQDRKTSAELIREVNARNRKYRLAMIFLIFFAVLFLGIVIINQLNTNSKLTQQDAARAERTAALQQQILQTGSTTNEYLQCIARFFAESDRTNLTITDLDKCNLQRNGQTVPGIDTKSTADSLPQQTVSPTPSSVNDTETRPTDDQGTGQVAAPLQEPVKLLGIPLCVPLVNLCLSQPVL